MPRFWNRKGLWSKAAIKGMSPGAFVHEYCQPTPEKGIAMKYPCTVAKAAITWLEEHR